MQIEEYKRKQHNNFVYTSLAKRMFQLLQFMNIKIHPLIITTLYTCIPWFYYNWVQETGYNQKTDSIFMIFFLYMILKQFNKVNLIKTKDAKKYVLYRYLTKFVDPVGLFYLYSILFNFSLRYQLEIQLCAMLFSTIIPFVLEEIQNQSNLCLVFKIINKFKGIYSIFAQIFLLVFIIYPKFKHVYILDFKFPYFISMGATILASMIALFYILWSFISNFHTLSFFKNNRHINIYKVVFLISAIYPFVFHFFMGFNLDTILNSRFMYQIWLCLNFGHFCANIDIIHDTEKYNHIRVKTINFSFVYGFLGYFSQMILFYFFPVQNIVVRIIITHSSFCFVFLPCFVLLLRQGYESWSIIGSKICKLNHYKNLPQDDQKILNCLTHHIN